MAGFYHRFIPNFSARAVSLTDMTGSQQPNQLEWTEKGVEAFKNLQQALSKEPVLFCPDIDKDFVLQTNASYRSIGAVLLQGLPDDHQPVAYISRKVFPREVRYATIKKEALAFKWALDSFKYYLLGRQLTSQLFAIADIVISFRWCQVP